MSLKLVDKTTGANTFTASGSLADSLGFTGTNAVSGEISGKRILSTLTGPLLTSLNGGDGLGTLGTLTLTNRAGVTSNIDLSTAKSLDEVIRKINNTATGIVASYNKSKTGIKLQDITGSSSSNLVATDLGANSTASKLGIEKSVASSSFEGDALNLQFVTRQTKLSALNQGRGVQLGSFTITNSAGVKSAINLATSGASSLGQVIDAINGLNISVEAKLNDAGDGIYLIDNANGPAQMIVAESGNGSAAADLGILGTSSSKIIDGVSKKAIESNQNFSIDVDADDTLNSLMTSLKSSTKSPINASLLNTGNGTVRLVLTAKNSGIAGRFSSMEKRLVYLQHNPLLLVTRPSLLVLVMSLVVLSSRLPRTTLRISFQELNLPFKVFRLSP